MVSKPTIAVDIDDVLSATAEGFTEFSNQKWGTKLTPSDFTEHWTEMWQIDHDEAIKRREVFLKSGLAKRYKHFEEAKPVLEKLAPRYKLILVTSRSKELYKDTLEWIDTYFKNIFSDLHLSGIYDDTQRGYFEKINMSKSQILKQIGVDYLIDDYPKHCIPAAEAGLKTVLFGNYPWNKDIKAGKNLVRAKNWQEVLEYFESESAG